MSAAYAKRILPLVIIAAVIAALIALFLYAAGFFGRSHVTAQQFVDFQEGGSPHAGFRRAHAKGVCVEGDFVASGALSEYTRSAIFAEGSTPFIGRFSIGTGNPSAPDLSSGVRSLALTFDAGANEQWRTAMNTPPVMAVATPDAFFAQLNALMPDPETGERDPQRIAEFFAAHPETQTFREWSAGYTPTGSYASEQYNSINAFYLINRNGDRQAVRWAAVPRVQIDENPYADTDQADNALGLDIAERIEEGPVVYDLVFTLATDEDDPNNPTVAWPDSREQVTAGQIVIQRLASDDAQCNSLNFDPLVLPRGMQASEDPILRARSAAYAESYRRRARETWLGGE
ncbi:MAG: catalase family peroxidase [Idiomarina sp.]|nr:catalase family peroxidase [Idiomarina sp.]